jgi:hypothetical protein
MTADYMGRASLNCGLQLCSLLSFFAMSRLDSYWTGETTDPSL